VGSHKILHKILQRIGATVAFATWFQPEL
jgi:hypothetical protein